MSTAAERSAPLSEQPMDKEISRAEKLFTVLAILYFSRAFFRSLSGLRDVTAGTPEGSPLGNVLWVLLYLTSIWLLQTRCGGFWTSLSKFRPFFLLYGIVLASATWSDAPLISLMRFGTLLATAFFALYLGIRYSCKMQLRLFGWAYGSAAILSAVFSLLFPAYSIGTGSYEGMWMGIYTDKNTLGCNMAIGFIVFLLLAYCYPAKRWYFRALAAFAVVLIVLANSATSMIECVAMCWVIPFLARLQPSDRPRRKFSLYFLVVVGLLLLLAPVLYFDQILNLLGRNPGLTGRVLMAGLTTEFIAQRPLLGYGYYAFWRGADGPLGEYWAAGVGNNTFDYLNVWLDLGIGGFVVFFATILYTVRRAFRQLRRSQKREDTWPLLYFSWLFIYSLSEAVFGSNTEMWMIFVALATTLYVQETAGVRDKKFALRSQAACAES